MMQFLQVLFHKLLVVHTSPKIQVERLVARDNIPESEALTIIKSQLSIDEKAEYADYVVYNDKSLDETSKQVGQLWDTLKQIQQENK